MKTFLVTLAFLFTTSAFAEVRNEVMGLSKVSFDGNELSLGYSIGGGCQEHRTEVEVEIEKTNVGGYDQYKAIVKVFDVTNEPDFCQALLYMEHTVEIKSLIQQEAEAAGFQGNYIEVVLPRLSIGW